LCPGGGSSGLEEYEAEVQEENVWKMTPSLVEDLKYTADF